MHNYKQCRTEMKMRGYRKYVQAKFNLLLLGLFYCFMGASVIAFMFALMLAFPD